MEFDTIYQYIRTKIDKWSKIYIVNIRYQNWSILEYYILTLCIFPSDIPKAWLWSYCITRLHHILQFDLKMTKALQTIDYVTVTRLFMLLFNNRILIFNIFTQIPKCNVWRIELLTMPYSRVTSKSQPKREWVRTFEVGKPRKNENHMIYDVTSVLFPAGFPEAGTRLTTIKRYSQFQKLYNSLLQIHQVWYP